MLICFVRMGSFYFHLTNTIEEWMFEDADTVLSVETSLLHKGEMCDAVCQ